MPGFHLARFAVDATPPIGHPLCGGWIPPVSAVDGRLSLRGVVLLGAGMPVVLAALDWTGVMNESHRLWTEALAGAAHTTPDRVALHCVHQHNAPFIDRAGNSLLKSAGLSPTLYDERFVDELVKRSADAVLKSLTPAQPVTHIQVGTAEVTRVASNRRVLGLDGKVKIVRYSASTDPAARDAPEGTIDPRLTSVSLFSRDRPLARLYYYTVHPMSYYADGRVNPDLVGLARERRDADEPGVAHLYFTGSAGNVTAGKYNDGSHPMRPVLADRVYQAMCEADREAESKSVPLEAADWRTLPLTFEPRADLDVDHVKAVATDPASKLVDRNRSSMAWAWLDRLSRKRPILLSRLDIGPATLLHLPAETFVEYQLEAQSLVPNRVLATAAYGDGGPWYIPLTRSFAEGGYEPTVAFVHANSENRYRQAIKDLLAADNGDGAGAIGRVPGS